MKCSSLMRLLEVALLLFQKQQNFMNVFKEDFLYLQMELEWIHQALLNELGLTEGLQEEFSTLFWNYSRSSAGRDELESMILKWNKMEINSAVNGETCLSTDSINMLFEIMQAIKTKKTKIESLLGVECEFLALENKMLKSIVLEELGKKRYF